MAQRTTLGDDITVVWGGDASVARSAVIVLHQAGGLSPQVDEVTDRLAADGHYVVAPDLLHRKHLEPGVDPMAQFGGDLDAFSRWLEGQESLLDTLQTMLDHLSELGFEPEQIAVVGFSYGGYTAFLAARTFTLGAAVSWYAPGIVAPTFGSNPELQPQLGGDQPVDLATPWLGIFGGLDFLVAAEEVESIRATVASAAVPTKVVVFPAVGHAFDMVIPGASRDDAVVADAVGEETAWLGSHLGSRTAR